MPESPEDLHARAGAAAGDDGRLPLPDMTGWVQFPWEVVDGELVATVLQAPVDRDHPRRGRADCPMCAAAASDRVVWEDERFLVTRMARPGGLLVLFLQTREHLDYPEMDDELAAECGRLQVVLCRVMESLPHVGRVHVGRWGDGAEHMHVWFIARPERFAQIVGSMAVEWDEILPPLPPSVLAADLAEVARRLATHGGHARA